MPQFKYKGRDKEGKPLSGTQSAVNERAIATALLAQGITPLQIVELGDQEETAEKKSGALDIDLRELLSRSVPLTDVIMFIRQMYSLTKAGVPMIRAIEGLADNATNRRLGKALHDVAQQLERGRTLSSAMADHPNCFPKLLIAVVHVGENTGRLDESFLQVGQYLERELETRKRIKAATRYPIFVIFFLVAAMAILNIFVIPQFASMFSRAGVELPGVTLFLLATSNFFVNYWWVMIVLAAITVAIVFRILQIPKFREAWDRRKLKLPLIGSVIERSMLSQFARSFSVMLDAGVPLTQSLGLVSETIDNAYMSRRVREMRRGIERGESLTRVSRASDLFTPLVLQMIMVGEETGSLDQLLAEAGDYYEREVDYDLKNLTTWIEPILISGVAAMVLVLALGIFLPMWDMMGLYS
ncbi:type II secretion system F family protein [Aliidiomarina haloalkalitolerans]|uniref:MSHA biogenesis protein MshG n=1 Tax=Aliidiomarina haloalkalitolerans TaxID=859059 RepID=A0A432VPN5_9GAMM|nr:type II secretion system F family protein [Aliidiomarina haloalkalitolerans]RUO18074.1 MSHA biogenesis protein MshG [Aliidiomarina haloalkalitolerans]